ncbi:KRAB-A domain-containing protein 2-like [Rhopalosiphum padi]|uniref:KRAB-A domain-containing protein 2-like n=1 Tax=Rhopalosiphum padi TaxID=40932 RepID=UPI00298D97F3|nr:KRAB-A domain-containing protein 2-like [Rhopalosiphum padi]
MAIDIQTVRTTFNEKLKNILTSKRDDNNSFLSTKDYNDVIEQVKKSKMCLKTVAEAKTMKDYRVVRKYDILKINGKERLIRPVDEKNVVLYYVKIDELFDILHETRSAIGHGGRNRMMAELKNKYCNITNETVMVYLKLCVQCQKKAVHPRRGLVSKPILESTFNSRAQVDLIDMQSQHYNDYRFIMNYQDHLTKYVILKPLKSKRAEEIAYNLIDIYTLFGAPAILQSDNGREFVNSVINELHIMWNEVKIVHGKPRHSQSQGSVERANRDVQEMLAAWMNKAFFLFLKIPIL